MKLTELLISIVIFSLVLTVSFSSYISIVKNQNNIKEKILDADKVLEIDNQIRNKIRLIKIAYYENFIEKAKLQSKEILLQKICDDVQIKSSALIINNNKNPIGLEVEWNYKSATYKTKEHFSSMPILENVNE